MKNSVRLNGATHLLNEFEKTAMGLSMYPFQENVENVLSSLVRFLLKSIFCAYDFLAPLPIHKQVAKGATSLDLTPNRKPHVPIPTWYEKVGTYTVMEKVPDSPLQKEIKLIDDTKIDLTYAEFLPYNAAELSIQMEAFYNTERLFTNVNEHDTKTMETEKAKMRQIILSKLGLDEDPVTFFGEMHQVMSGVPHAMIGKETKKNTKENQKNKTEQKLQPNPNCLSITPLPSKRQEKFEKYLSLRWKELKKYVKEIKNTKCEDIYFYLPLLDFETFLENMRTKQSHIDKTLYLNTLQKSN
ncbi:hypothetical protein RFI_11043 [Reticulomyxa filosa]|uniref:Uncharacterized protein n=1 Tax=Reticulomyxa filosa TaxID=46433 RepID=X6NK39_RETFI|nr:hypothetical protein RFI_11043 [Reticulomyxa filosa]|eukprot:ETO26094.1 hypothetical protein RFI_11043 [Reticulomyxa filosa]